MEGAAVKEMAERFRKPETVDVGSMVATPPGWTIVDPEAQVYRPLATALNVATLTALQAYLGDNRDQLALEHLVVHVASPTIVNVLGSLTDVRSREAFLTATATDLTAGNFLNGYHPIENFLIGLQTRFVDSPERTALLRFLSSIKSQEVRTALDDGMTQVVEARSGVALVKDAEVPNPVLLQPFRTFREVEQPASLFVLRLQQGVQGGLPQAALFEADGGAWRLEAIERVGRWLRNGVPAVSILA